MTTTQVPRWTLSVAVGSSEHVKVPVRYQATNGETDPTRYVVEFQFAPEGQAPDGTWTVGAWESEQTDPPWWSAWIAVGPGGLILPVGTYDVWVRVTTAFETPVRSAGKLVIY